MISAGFFPNIGGVESQLRGLSASLLRQGLDVEILTRRVGDEALDDEVDGVPVHRVRLIQSSRTLASMSFLAGGLAWLRSRRGEFDLLHCHQAYSPLTLAVLARRATGNPRILVKLTTSGSFSEIAAVTRELPFHRVRKRILRQVDAFIAISGEIAAEIESAGISPERIVRIPNGVALPPDEKVGNEARARARAELALPFRRLAVFVGRLASEKGLFVLVEAFREVLSYFPDAGLLVVGEGGTARSVEVELRRKVGEMGIERSVRFTGRVEDVGPALAASDVLVLCSFTEGMSNAILESMAYARPAVVSDIPGNRELITGGENGFLVPPGDASTLARAIREVFASGSRAEAMGRASRLRVEREFSFRSVSERYLRLYSRLLGCPGHVRGLLSTA